MNAMSQSGPPMFSVQSALRGAAVLLTGATGFVGSLVLEQLLRCVPDVGTIYVLCRDKRDLSAERRLRRLLHTGVFHLVRDRPQLLAKVCLVEGDLLSPLPQLGIPSAARASNSVEPASDGRSSLGQDSPSSSMPHYWDVEGQHVRSGTLDMLLTEPRIVVIHSAARIALEDPVQATLRHNYVGTSNLLALVQQLPGACVFLHVSTAFVNCCKPFLPSGTPKECIYPLHFGETGKVHHARLVEELMTLEPAQAAARCAYLCHLWGFPNSYVLGKHLTEQLVVDRAGKLRVSIVRPTLVGALAGLPYPGFVGNLAGPSGYAVACALGFFQKNVTMFSPMNHFDCVPGDVASSIIITAAAATLAGFTPMGQQTSVLDAETGGVQAVAPVPIYHAASSVLSPLSHYEAFGLAKAFYKKHPYKFKFGKNMPVNPSYKPVMWKSVLARGLLKFQVRMAAGLLRCFGQERQAHKLQTGFQQFIQTQIPENDFALFFDMSNVQELDQLLCKDERILFPLLWAGDWVRYARTYMAAVLKLFMGQSVPLSEEHGFVHIPDRRVA